VKKSKERKETVANRKAKQTNNSHNTHNIRTHTYTHVYSAEINN